VEPDALKRRRKINNTEVHYFTPRSRKGKSRMELINLKINSSENPTIRNGSNRSQRRGNKKMIIKAKGQQSVNSIHQSRIVIIVFMEFFEVVSKSLANSKNLQNDYLLDRFYLLCFICEHTFNQKRTAAKQKNCFPLMNDLRL
jgi:hypothetical protein